MTDREEVMAELTGLQLWLKGQVILVPGHEDWQNALKVCTNALDLLKEQEPIEPVDDGHGSLICGNQGYECGCVGRYDLTTKVVEKYCNFCPECGRKVKWDD